MLHTLDQLTASFGEPQKRLEETECKDLDTYNEATGEGLPRLVFACDEVAEMLDKTGADNERKKLLAQIENKLSTIARQGRAFGIHLILATQRPDATIIPGQIRNNMDFRVCGRADSVLSQIIPRQHQRRRADTKRRKGPFHHRGWDCVPGLPVQRGAAIRLGAVPMARKKKVNDYGTGIPYHEVEALARVLLPEIQAFSRARKDSGNLPSGKRNRNRTR